MGYDFVDRGGVLELLLSGGVLTASLIIVVICMIAAARVFAKAGENPIWAFIPIVNLYKIFKIAWGEGLVFLALCIPIVNFFVAIILNLKLAKSFGRGTLFGIGLLFFPYIFMCIIAFSGMEYLGPNGEGRGL